MIDEKRLIEEINKEICANCSEEYCLGHCNVRLIEELINNQLKVGEWIPCSVDMPKKATVYEVTEEVFFNSKKQYVVEHRLFGTEGKWLTPSNRKVIAWMELPPAYKGE